MAKNFTEATQKEITDFIFRNISQNNKSFLSKFDPLTEASEEDKLEIVFNIQKFKNANNKMFNERGLVPYTKEIHSTSLGTYIQSLGIANNILMDLVANLTINMVALTNKIDSEISLNQRTQLFDENHVYTELINFVKESNLGATTKSSFISVILTFVSLKNTCKNNKEIYDKVKDFDSKAFKDFFKTTQPEKANEMLEEFEDTSNLVTKQERLPL